jgi:hypothetical protein
LFVHGKVVTVMTHQLVGFLEGAFVEEQVDPLARGEFPFGVLAGAALVSATRFGGRVAALQFFHPV